MDNKGLIAGHAYSVENFKTIQGHELVRLRNPWGEGAWTGDWSNQWINKNRKTGTIRLTNDEKKDLDVNDDLNIDDDGRFWMKWNDFIDEFENLSVCHLSQPDSIEYEKRVRGTFRYPFVRHYFLFYCQ